MTLNNPTEEMMVLVRNPNHDYIRQLIWTAEKAGTPHLQCYLKLVKQQRMSFVKKLYPGGHFQPISSAEYLRNAIDYAQKEDETTVGAHVNTLCDTIADPVYLLNRLIRTIIDRDLDDIDDHLPQPSLDSDQLFIEYNKRLMGSGTFQQRMKCVLQEEEGLLARVRPSICKLLVSAQYNKIKDDWLLSIVKYNIDKYVEQRDANDNEGQGTGESELLETESISSSSSEEEEFEEDEGSSIEGSDSGSESDSQTEGGDETEY